MTADHTPTALDMSAQQRDISVSEFFLRNRHLLGFDSGAKALVTTVKEAVDNALDACEEAGILPEIQVEVSASRHSDDVFLVAVEDNGPGIVEKQLARIFGKLLYGSRFHKLAQSRGQQGMGISAAGMYAQLTTGKPLHVLSRVRGQAKATEMYVSIDTARNRPELHRKRHVNWDRPHGTRVEAELEGHYQKGPHSIQMYLKQTAMANPHVTLRLREPDGERLSYERCLKKLPPRPVAVKPHPHGVELGVLIQMLRHTRSRNLLQFLEREFARVGPRTAQAIIQRAHTRLSSRSYPTRIAHDQANALYRAMQNVPVSAPRTDCIVPIGETQILAGLEKEVAADFYTVLTRPPAVYRGNPFQVEVAIAYGRPAKHGHAAEEQQEQAGAAEMVSAADDPVRVLRFANRVPLLYEPGACAVTKAVIQTNWRHYGLKQGKKSMPVGPMLIMAHVASVWVPFTSEAKEAIAAYPEILRELTLGMQECGRRLASHLRHEAQRKQELKKRAYIEKYLPYIGEALQDILELSDGDRDTTVQRLDENLRRRREH
ncbi:MAG TPA: DNA topoisomerase VI subunit B [Arenicellales bacterium]|nr:DNA topoisomerase VI subunit B [Arenicellales bacterium]